MKKEKHEKSVRKQRQRVEREEQDDFYREG